MHFLSVYLAHISRNSVFIHSIILELDTPEDLSFVKHNIDLKGRGGVEETWINLVTNCR